MPPTLAAAGRTAFADAMRVKDSAVTLFQSLGNDDWLVAWTTSDGMVRTGFFRQVPDGFERLEEIWWVRGKHDARRQP